MHLGLKNEPHPCTRLAPLCHGPVPNITPAECILVLYAPPSRQRTADVVIPSAALDAGCEDSLPHCVPEAYYLRQAWFPGAARHVVQPGGRTLLRLQQPLGLLLSSAGWTMVRRRCCCCLRPTMCRAERGTCAHQQSEQIAPPAVFVVVRCGITPQRLLLVLLCLKSITLGRGVDDIRSLCGAGELCCPPMAFASQLTSTEIIASRRRPQE